MADPRKCPVCTVVFLPTRYAGIDFEVCPKCLGHWFDYLELRRVQSEAQIAARNLDAGTPAAHPNAGSTALHCPVCGENMLPYHYALDECVELQTCHHCGGIWVPHGALIAMTDATIQAKRAAYRSGGNLRGAEFVKFPCDVAPKTVAFAEPTHDPAAIDLDHPLRGAPDVLANASTPAAEAAVGDIAQMEGEVERSKELANMVETVSDTLKRPTGVSLFPYLHF